MLHIIRKWVNNLIERRRIARRKKTLEIIKKAKQAYLDGLAPCMCFCFIRVEPSFLCPDMIAERIPEFKPSTFGVDRDITGVWWPCEDRQSRINAFDKLIEIYSK